MEKIYHKDTEDTEFHRGKDFCFGAFRQSKIIIFVQLCALCVSVVKSFAFPIPLPPTSPWT
jgi:hypothetical protein